MSTTTAAENTTTTTITIMSNSSTPPSSKTKSSSVLLPPTPFSLTGDKYDQDTYYGRFRKMIDLVDPRTLFHTQQDLQDAQRLLKEYKNQRHALGTTDFDINSIGTTNEFWNAKQIRDSMTHPDTEEIIPKPFRMSGFLPFNAPICVGALSATSPYSILFWQWLNQTHNAFVNYHNGNKTQPIDFNTTVQGYIGAVTGACGISLGLKTLIDKSAYDATRKLKLQRFIALPAIMSAAAINVILMRRNELSTGINVYYKNENNNNNGVGGINVEEQQQQQSGSNEIVVGSSQFAAKKALKEMVISRMALALPVFLLPPIGLSVVDVISTKSSLVKGLMNKSKHTSLVLNTLFVLIGFGVGLPATIALFPQNGSIPVTDLEERFQHLRDENGRPIRTLQYNKGL